MGPCDRSLSLSTPSWMRSSRPSSSSMTPRSAARRSSSAARAAAGWSPPRRTRRARVRRPLGDADGGGAAPLSAADRRSAARRSLCRSERPSLRGVPSLHAFGRGPLDRRSVPRRDGEPIALRRRRGDRAAHPRRRERGDRPHVLGRRRGVEVRREDRERHGQARRAHRRPGRDAGGRRCVSRAASDRANVGDRPEDGAELARARLGKTLGDLAKADPVALERAIGQWGLEIRQLARGYDVREVIPDRDAKSIGAECTYEHDLTSKEEIARTLLAHAARCAERLTEQGPRSEGGRREAEARRLHRAHAPEDASSRRRRATRARSTRLARASSKRFFHTRAPARATHGRADAGSPRPRARSEAALQGRT